MLVGQRRSLAGIYRREWRGWGDKCGGGFRWTRQSQLGFEVQDGSPQVPFRTCRGSARWESSTYLSDTAGRTVTNTPNPGLNPLP